MAINHLLGHGNGNPSSSDMVIHHVQGLFTNLETHQGGPKHHNRVKINVLGVASHYGRFNTDAVFSFESFRALKLILL